MKNLTWGTVSLLFGFAVLVTAIAVVTQPFGLSKAVSASVGLLSFLAATLLAQLLRRVSAQDVLAGFSGLFAGCLLGLILVSIANLASVPVAPGQQFFRLAFPILLGYVGLLVGLSRSGQFSFAVTAQASQPSESDPSAKLLDSSVLIDGRISDIVECGFLEGPLVVPRFVLHELQAVADSSDSARRTRGRRGLDVVQHLQGVPNLKVEVSGEDFPNTREVDLKLIELAKLRAAKIVTNDFNLNKLAQVQGIPVLNINQLASSLKPIVLPGELMRVFILKEGKEHNQGIAYLEDGTMVVVDNARRLISKNVDIVVTSVLQTTAGKMIFGRYDERAQSEIRPISATASS